MAPCQPLQTASSIRYPRACGQSTIAMLSLCFLSFILFACQVSHVQGGESDLYISDIYLYTSPSEAFVLPKILDYDTNTIKKEYMSEISPCFIIHRHIPHSHTFNIIGSYVVEDPAFPLSREEDLLGGEYIEYNAAGQVVETGTWKCKSALLIHLNFRYYTSSPDNTRIKKSYNYTRLMSVGSPEGDSSRAYDTLNTKHPGGQNVRLVSKHLYRILVDEGVYVSYEFTNTDGPLKIDLTIYKRTCSDNTIGRLGACKETPEHSKSEEPLTGWQTNTVWLLHHQTAKTLDVTDCWVCSHLPIDNKGIPLIGVPITLQDLNTIDYIHTSTVKSDKQFVRKLISTEGTALQIAGQAHEPSVCLKFSHENSQPTQDFIKQHNITFAIPAVYLGISNCDNIVVSTLNDTPVDQYSNYSCNDRCQDNIQWFQQIMKRHADTAPIVLKKGLYFICGNKAYSWLPMGGWGECTLGTVVPAIRVRYNITSLVPTPEYSTIQYTSAGRTNHTNKHNIVKRELFSDADKAWMWFPPWTGWGIELANRLNKYAEIMDGIVNETTSAIRVINDELSQVRKVALQNRMALDYILAAQGGVCALIGVECCTWIEDSYDPVLAHLTKVDSLQQKARDISKDGWNPFKWFGNIGSWLHNVFGNFVTFLLSIVIVIILIVIVVKILVKCCMNMEPKMIKTHTYYTHSN